MKKYVDLLVVVRAYPGDAEFVETGHLPQRALAEILALSGRHHFQLGCKDPLELQVEVCPESPTSAFNFLWPPARRHDDGWLLAFWAGTTVDALPEELRQPEISPEVGAAILADRFGVAVRNIFLASNLAIPGALTTGNGRVFECNELISDFGESMNYLGSNIEGLRSFGWPPIRRLSLTEVLDWLARVPGVSEAIGRGPLGRAIAALSRLTRDRWEKALEPLVWCFVGLEALYGDGGAKVVAQITQKSETLLGARVQDKKLLSRAYHFRSRFFHGDVDIPFAGCPYDAHPVLERFEEDLDRATLYATAVLVSSLQEVCRRDLTDLRFHWTVDDGEEY